MDISKISLSDIKNFIKETANDGIEWSKEAFSSIGEHLKNFPSKSISHLSAKYRTGKESFKELTSAIKNHTSNAITNIKVFFEKSPTIGEIYKDLGITDAQWEKFSSKLNSAIINITISDNNEDKSASYKYNLSNKLVSELKKYQTENTKEIQSLLEKVEENIKKLKPEVKLEEELNKQLCSIEKPSKQAKANAISKVYGGESIEKVFNLKINSKDVKVSTEVIPQVKLGGIPDKENLKQVSSEFGGKTTHATNLWQQNITVGSNPSVSFIRCGNTRGEKSPAEEILANALSLNFKLEDILKATDEKNKLELNFSNIQLMTPGKIAPITDGGMPFIQMKRFIMLSKEKQPLKLSYQGQDIFVTLNKPLLFNFGTNAQHFVKCFSPLLSQKPIDEQNNESFRNLLGDLKIFGGKNGEQMVAGHYRFDENSIIGKKLADPNLDSKTKEQIQNLADQIVDIYEKNRHGIEKNPYALPSRVALLTNLLGYATSYGCKSGKDRTGIMSMELENLTAKVLTDNEPYDPYNLTDTEKQNLQSIYKRGTAIDIAKVNTGDVQNRLKIIQLHGLFTVDKERFDIDLSRDFDENLKILENK